MINKHFAAMPPSYLFAEIGRRTAEFQAQNPNVNLIRMGIGDVTRPLVPAVVAAMHAAADEMANGTTFQGYPPYEGFPFLIDAIHAEYATLGIEKDEIFVSDGAKSDTSGFGDIFDVSARVAVCDPVYPVYVDSNAIAGRGGAVKDGRYANFVYLPCTAENGFCPALPDAPVDLIYLCSPNNPTGTAMTQDQLQIWVDYANQTGAVILYDGAYEAFIGSPGVPHSIYACKGAETCAVEFRSFSKTAGFTGMRCAYTVVPKALVRDGARLRDLWARRGATKFNGVSYITQKAAAATFSPKGKQQIGENIAFYKANARILLDGIRACGLTAYGGEDAPYVWFTAPNGLSSWDAFDLFLQKAHVVTTPGAGFGASGEGYVRVTAFGGREATIEAVERMQWIIHPPM